MGGVGGYGWLGGGGVGWVGGGGWVWVLGWVGWPEVIYVGGGFLSTISYYKRVPIHFSMEVHCGCKL